MVHCTYTNNQKGSVMTTRQRPRMLHKYTQLEDLLKLRTTITPILNPRGATLFEECVHCAANAHSTFNHTSNPIEPATWIVTYPYMEVDNNPQSKTFLQLVTPYSSSNTVTKVTNRVCNMHLPVEIENMRDYLRSLVASLEQAREIHEWN